MHPEKSSLEPPEVGDVLWKAIGYCPRLTGAQRLRRFTGEVSSAEDDSGAGTAAGG